jgi:phytol kinase
MLGIILSLFGILVLLVVTETLWIKKHLHVETARKIIHISTGVFIAFWPFWMSWRAIQIISLLMFLVIVVSHKFKIFNSIHGVSRLTKGELLYPLGIAIAAFVAPNPAIFTIAILNLALADGMASVIGHRYGFFNGYKILGHKKSVMGTITFFFISSLIFTAGIAASSFVDSFSLLQVVVLFPLLLAAIENISWYGLDNITVPVTAILLLSTL